MLQVVGIINTVIGIAFVACYFYQLVYILIPFIAKKRSFAGEIAMNRYAVLISARNEEAVIGHLIESVGEQDYPASLVSVFVVADNCTDHTAAVAREAGATVWERFNISQVGKGWALDFLLTKVNEQYGKDAFDGYFVFDADNVLDEHYISEMNKMFSAGHKIITSYRNSKNFGKNWISAGYALWFLRESQYLNNSRMLLGTSCAISGTGFLISRDIVEKNDGWKFFLLTEDIEFTMDSVISGEKIAYCKSAMLYDEQPVTFRQSWNQRLRWAKGFLQVFRKYGSSLFGTIVKKRNFACFDMMMTIMPAVMLTVVGVVCNVAAVIFGLVTNSSISIVITSLLFVLGGTYCLLLIVGGVTLITEWKNIYCQNYRKILFLFTFPLFMFTYIPIAVTAIFSHVEWTPIEHTDGKTLAQIQES